MHSLRLLGATAASLSAPVRPWEAEVAETRWWYKR
jgi:hypothetical protein